MKLREAMKISHLREIGAMFQSRTPTSVVLRRLRRIIEGEDTSKVLTQDMPVSMIGLLNLRYNYDITADHLSGLLGADGAIKYLNVEIAKACFRESGMVREQ